MRSVIESLYKAIDQSSFVLKEDPELTFPQLYNRLQRQAEQNEPLKKKLDFASKRFSKPWLRILSRSVRSAALVRTFTGHTKDVNACAFSPDGRLIVLGDQQGQVLLVTLENIMILPPKVTPYIKSKALFYFCPYCWKVNRIEEKSMGQENKCAQCSRTARLNSFTVKLE